MARLKLAEDKKKKELSLCIESELYKQFLELEIKNKSKFFNWLLEKYFNSLNEGRAV